MAHVAQKHGKAIVDVSVDVQRQSLRTFNHVRESGRDTKNSAWSLFVRDGVFQLWSCKKVLKKSLNNFVERQRCCHRIVANGPVKCGFGHVDSAAVVISEDGGLGAGCFGAHVAVKVCAIVRQ